MIRLFMLEETTMLRRSIRLLVTLALGLLVVLLAADAQQRGLPVIGFLSNASPDIIAHLVQLIRNNYSSSGRQGRCRGHDLGHGVCGPVKRMCMVIPFFNELVQLCMKLIFGCKIHNS
jgi:hypothetical protein